MNGASFYYQLTNLSAQGGTYITTNTSHTFGSLLSGTSYNFSVATVGAMNFESEMVQIYMVTTSKSFIYVPKQCADAHTFMFHLYYLVTFISLKFLSNNQDRSV